MEVIGKIIAVLPEMSGTSKSGNPWKKREYVLETLESFPRKIHFDFFGEKADQFPLTLNDTVKLSFDIESREYNGRWYTSIRGWKAEPAQQGQMPAGGFPTPAPPAAPGFGAAPQAAPAYQTQPQAGGFPTPPAPAETANDDLPF
ncbi:MAG: DUF3127 domain-containing protein [Muribaculaceae bacterium]|nr:DUF3127 domain-containing protein [Muribaculaceae bacterium]